MDPCAGDIVYADVLPGHQPAMALLVVELRRVTQVGPQVRRATLLRDLGQVGCVVRALAEQRMAVDAIVLVPDILAVSHCRRDVLGVGQGGKLSVAVDRETQEGQCRDQHGTDGEDPGLPLVQGVVLRTSDTDAAPVGQADIAGVRDARSHQSKDDEAEQSQSCMHSAFSPGEAASRRREAGQRHSMPLVRRRDAQKDSAGAHDGRRDGRHSLVRNPA